MKTKLRKNNGENILDYFIFFSDTTKNLDIDFLVHTHTHIYIFTNLIPTSIHGTRKKKKEKKTRQEQEIKVSRITTRGKNKRL